MSQVTDINTILEDDYENDNSIFAFVTDNIYIKVSEGNKTSKSFYSQLKPNFTETVNWITTQEEVDQFAKLMDNFLSGFKKKYKEEKTKTCKTHNYVSSNLPIKTARKHHGCNGWKQLKKR